MSRTGRLGIVIPLKSAVASRNWKRTCGMLEGTLRSILGQTSEQWEAVVVGHEKPEGVPSLDSGRVDFLSLDLPVPPLKPGGSYLFHRDFDYILDKNRKIVRGLQGLRDREITHWFVLDADDLLHRQLVEKTVLPDEAKDQGALLNRGYLFYPDLKRQIPCDHLIQICGSTTILPSSWVEVPESLAADWSGVPWCRLSHADMGLLFRERQSAPNFPEERLIAYVQGYGDNCSDEFRQGLVRGFKAWLKPRLIGRRMDAGFCRDFSLGGAGWR